VKERGGQINTAVTWHVRALSIRLVLRTPHTASNLRRLAEYRRELGTTQFTSLLTGTADDPDLADSITSALDQLDMGNDGTIDPAKRSSLARVSPCSWQALPGYGGR
jgi:hypothetical protein